MSQAVIPLGPSAEASTFIQYVARRIDGHTFGPYPYARPQPRVGLIFASEFISELLPKIDQQKERINAQSTNRVFILQRSMQELLRDYYVWYDSPEGIAGRAYDIKHGASGVANLALLKAHISRPLDGVSRTKLTNWLGKTLSILELIPQTASKAEREFMWNTALFEQAAFEIVQAHAGVPLQKSLPKFDFEGPNVLSNFNAFFKDNRQQWERLTEFQARAEQEAHRAAELAKINARIQADREEAAAAAREKHKAQAAREAEERRSRLALVSKSASSE